MYVIDGAAGCRDVIDIGETSYSMPLVGRCRLTPG
jgi:hypothetical protein